MLHARLVLMFVIENNEFSQALSLHLSDDPRLHPSSYTKQTMHKINPDHNFPLFDDLETKSNKIMFQLKRVGIFLETGKITFKRSTNMYLYKYLFATEAEDVIDRQRRGRVRYKPVSPHIVHIIMLSSEARCPGPCDVSLEHCLLHQESDDDGIS